MGKVKWLGLLAFGGGLLLLGFQGIAYMMAEGAEFYNHTMISLFGEETFGWIERFPIASLRSPLDSLTEAPLFIVLIVVGVIFLVIHGFFAKS